MTSSLYKPVSLVQIPDIQPKKVIFSFRRRYDYFGLWYYNFKVIQDIRQRKHNTHSYTFSVSQPSDESRAQGCLNEQMDVETPFAEDSVFISFLTNEQRVNDHSSLYELERDFTLHN
jgi:hypothetical protein